MIKINAIQLKKMSFFYISISIVKREQWYDEMISLNSNPSSVTSNYLTLSVASGEGKEMMDAYNLRRHLRRPGYNSSLPSLCPPTPPQLSTMILRSTVLNKSIK